jgi:glycolate oxidase iron-sulfur subunit
MTEAVQACVHCGFCLSTCPTYKVLGRETDSPRGRIVLMKHVLEGKLEYEQARPHIDTCLGCLACETACPSGVAYRELIHPFRAHTRPQTELSFVDRCRHQLIMHTLPHPQRFRFAAHLGRWAKPFRRLLPRSFHAMLDLLPETLPPAQSLHDFTPAQGKRRARVALLAGCAQQVLEPDINHATIAVLSRNGVEVVTPQNQGCCGALAWHEGDEHGARKCALHNLNVFPDDVDAVVANAAGCGSGLYDYAFLFIGTDVAQRAKEFSARAIDICAFLDQLGILPPPALPRKMKAAYHDACHLSHAQSVRTAPRKLLQAIENLELLEIPDQEICCGSAGAYNINQPHIADELGRRKTLNILAVKPDLIALGNIGCMMQIRAHLRRENKPIPVLHTVQILHRAYTGKL